ncbi:MAG: hypothetical protein ACREP9_09625, partial [Candidatus Dormibacteraceae bacterium]
MKRKQTTGGPDHGKSLPSEASSALGRLSRLIRFPILASCFAGATLLLMDTAQAANWYVRASSTGASTGKDWNNAWSLSGISWGSVAAGDTIYIAGGSYGGGFSSSKSGSAGAPIQLRRATSTNPACTAAAGWSSALDGTINLAGITISHNYVVLSGEVASGIIVNQSGVGGWVKGGCTGVTLSYIEFTASSPAGANNQGLLVSYGNQTAVINLTVDHCLFHHLVNGIQCYFATGLVIQYSEFYDINNQGSTG